MARKNYIDELVSSKFAVTDPADGVSISFNNGKIRFVASGTVTSTNTNHVDSVESFTGKMVLRVTPSATPSVFGTFYGFKIYNASDPYATAKQIQIFKQPSSYNAAIRVFDGSIFIYDIPTGIAYSGNVFKIVYETNFDIKFYYLNGSTWTLLGSTNYDIGPNRKISFAANSSQPPDTGNMLMDFGSAYLTNYDYATSIPPQKAKGLIQKPNSDIYFNGKNQIALGTSGVNGFSGTAFQSKSQFTFNCIIKTFDLFTATSPRTLIFEMADSSRQNSISVCLGPASIVVNNEFLSFGRFVTNAGKNFNYLTTGNYPAGEKMLTLTSHSTGGSIYIDGVLQATNVTINEAAHYGTLSQTVHYLSLGGATANGANLKAIVREASFFGRLLTAQEITDLYTYYTSGGDLFKPKSLRYNDLYNDANLIELYSGLISNGQLVASKSPSTRNLVLTNF